MVMRILGIDPGTNVTGYGMIEKTAVGYLRYCTARSGFPGTKG